MRSVLSLASVVGFLVLGCGPSFDPPSELRSLRVLGVVKDHPYAQPGEAVNLQLLWQDASAERGRDVQVVWTPPCFDPPGDLYYACFADSTLFKGTLSTGQDSASFVVPLDIISRRPAATSSNNAAYGITYVFFALCAGQLAPASQTSATSFPLACKDAAGNALGSDDFVAGYTAIYSFESFSNHNPVISGFRFNGYDFPPDADNPNSPSGDAGASNGGAGESAAGRGFCLGAACQRLAAESSPEDFDCAVEATRCMPTCSDDGDSSCTGYSIRPIVDQGDPNNRDQDDVSAQLRGRNVGEQMWIDYYTEAGGFKSAVRLLNDATAGWNENYGTELYAPKAPGPFRVWAVAHDNRGGASWTGVTLKAR